MRHWRLFALAAGAVAALAWFGTHPAMAQDSGPVIMDMDMLRHKPSMVKDKAGQEVPIGSAELVDGKFNKAVKFTFVQPVTGFFNAGFAPNPAWNEAAGISFWVKGDGSRNWGGIELIDNSNYGLRYGYCFPLDSTEWKKITVPWRDLIPEKDGPLIDPASGYKPGGFGNLWIGKWHYWRDFPPHSFTIDHIALEKQIELDNTDYTPAGDGLARVREKIRRRQPVTIVFMGDSLTDPRHNSNQKITWVDMLAQDLKSRGVNTKMVNVAMGGRALNHLMILMPQWVRENPSPDLVVVFFGYNDWDNGVRGPRYKEYLNLAVDRIRRMTDGKADVLLLTTLPAHGRWETMKELEQAAREVAQEKKTGLADVAEAFRKAGKNPDAAQQAEFWHWDKTHLGEKGKALIKDVVLKTLTE